MLKAVIFTKLSVASTFVVIRVFALIFDSNAGFSSLFLFLCDLFLQRLQVQVSQQGVHIFHN